MKPVIWPFFAPVTARSQAANYLHALPHLQSLFGSSWSGLGSDVGLVEGRRLPVVQANSWILGVHKRGDLPLLALVPTGRQAASDLYALADLQALGGLRFWRGLHCNICSVEGHRLSGVEP